MSSSVRRDQGPRHVGGYVSAAPRSRGRRFLQGRMAVSQLTTVRPSIGILPRFLRACSTIAFNSCEPGSKRVLIPPRPQNPLIGLQPPQRQIPRLRDLAEQFANGRCSAGHALLEAKIVYQSQFLGGQRDLKALTPRPTRPFWTSVDFVKVICEANLRRPS